MRVVSWEVPTIKMKVVNQWEPRNLLDNHRGGRSDSSGKGIHSRNCGNDGIQSDESSHCDPSNSQVGIMGKT